MNSGTVLKLAGLEKVFSQGEMEVPVFRDLDFTLDAGQSCAIVGPSGAGKSTLLHLMGGLDKPSAGKVELMGQDLASLPEHALGRFRNCHLGFVYQFHHLLAEFTVLENIMFPAMIAGQSRQQAADRARELAERLQIDHRIDHKPSEVSGGERQRTAVARALCNRPACILADEPTGNLDEHTASLVFDAFLELAELSGTALVVVSHNRSLASRAGNIFHLSGGRLHSPGET